MSPENQQTVYTVIDCFAVLLPAFLTGFAIAGLFAGSAKAVANRPWLLLWVASVVWIVLRVGGVVA